MTEINGASMFLYNRDLNHESVKAEILHKMIVQCTPLVIMPDSFFVSIFILKQATILATKATHIRNKFSFHQLFTEPCEKSSVCESAEEYH